mmetsp:Transcript_25978/g.71275  ORF Transcript_25978/g.71275 Transcript_25978/m.71275 type:complete len:826 (+) Transcript_25978:155-2632(+)|eukprot:CAMPEP_0172367996 /NCGR_PEP_ID=MMETSP1060-20121228/24857_1 /TAXON_ID=37318 /ORGANISM="Pseudo-nitzschia pungens, Strain cf. cingulata" /LENGTH=825 /DNA_ID=CAMNT_0013092449 /DNA_START=76 /DNA_END=2553 /DNA_ORIENTATION=+
MPGFVRRMLLKGSSFSSLNNSGSGEFQIKSSSGRTNENEGSKWRSRRNQFERLDGEDDDSLSGTFQIENSFSSSWGIDNNSTLRSTRSESGECGRDVVCEKAPSLVKRTPTKNSNRRKKEFTPIKPPVKDTSSIRGPASEKKTPAKKQLDELEWATNDTFGNNEATDAKNDPFFGTMSGASGTDSFGFQINRNDENANSMTSPVVPPRDELFHASHQPSSSNKTPNPSSSDPTEFFSKEQTTTLTMCNLAKMDSSFNNASDVNTEKISAMDGMERIVKERKFYQFTIDEDKASTVVESTLQLPLDYPFGDKTYDDDYTEFSCSQTSQGTRIQQRTKNNQRTSNASEAVGGIPSTSGNDALEVKEFDPFCQKDGIMNKEEQKDFDAFFPHDTKKDEFFPDFAGKQEQTRPKLASESDISSSWGDAYFERSFKSSNEFAEPPSQSRRGRLEERCLQQVSTTSVASHQVSTKSLCYSPSPVHNKRNSVTPQNGRQPLTSKNTQSSGGKKNSLPYTKKNDWVSENAYQKASEFKFDDFNAQPRSGSRNPSIASGNTQMPPTDPFDPRQRRVSAKENVAFESNRHGNRDGDWKGYQKNHPPLRRTDQDDEDVEDDDDDSFEDVGPWEKPSSMRHGSSRLERRNSANRRPNSLHDHSSYSRPRGNQYIDDDYIDNDNRSVGGFSVEKKVSRPSRSRSSAGSYTKPLALPSNAIVGSMLFRAHHDIDQHDVEEKLNKFDEENSKEKEVRHLCGDIPDSVHADTDHMTTVSSFSDATSAYLYDSWRKPSRDLVAHLSSARALDTMDYHGARRVAVREPSQTEYQQSSSGLFEA